MSNIGLHSTVQFNDSDDELPADIIVNERQSLLLGLDQHNGIPRYMTASPCMCF